MSLTNKKGFTLIELAITIGILGLLLAIAIPSYATLRNHIALSNYTDEIVSALRTAQNNAMVSQGGVAHGLHLETNRYCEFAGTSFSGCASPYYSLSGGIKISSGTGNIVFARFSGMVAAQVNIVLQASGTTNKTITVETSGKIYEQ